MSKIDNKFGWPLPPGFVQKDRIGPGEEWHWMDQNWIVHRAKHVVIKMPGGELKLYTSGVTACDTENKSICEYLHCNMPVTCVACLAR